jgi:hypothetical protein
VITVPFVKLWDSILDNVKVQRLNAPVFMAWINLLAVTARYGGERGELPSWEDMAFGLRASKTTIKGWIDVLVTAGLIDKTKRHYSIHDFEKWNDSKDKTAAKRQREWRQRQALRNAQRNAVTEAQHNTPQDNEGYEENEEEEEGKDSPPPPAEPLPEENTRVCDLAAKIGGDISWAMWASRRMKLGDSPAVLEAALSEAVNCGKVNQPYVAKIAARYAKDGIPKVSTNGHHTQAKSREDGLPVLKADPDSPFSKLARGF